MTEDHTQNLKDERGLIHMIFDALPIGIFEINENGHILYTNKKWQEIFNKSLVESTDTRWDELLKRDDKENLFEEWQRMRESHSGFVKECRIVSLEGQIKLVLMRLLPIFADEGIRHIGTVEDITARRQAEIDPREADNQLEERMKEQTLELKRVNDLLEDETAVRKNAEDALRKYQEAIQLMVEDQTKELREAQRELVNRAMESGRAQLSAMVLHNIGNAITPLNIQIEELKRGGGIKDLISYLEKCYLDLKEHAIDLSHYVNNDTRGKEVFSYMGNLVDSLKEYLKKRGIYLNKIEQEISYVSEILTLQQAYAASEKETKVLTDLNDLMEDAIRMQRRSLEDRRITIKKGFDRSLPKLMIDKNRLMQVIVNLIKNGYEAIDELNEDNKEKIISFKTYKDDDRVCFEITDNGIGVESEKIKTLFEFGKSYKGSSGFGLYYCAMFVEANMGTLEFNSPGKGKGAKVKVIFQMDDHQNENGVSF